MHWQAALKGGTSRRLGHPCCTGTCGAATTQVLSAPRAPSGQYSTQRCTTVRPAGILFWGQMEGSGPISDACALCGRV